MPALRFRGFYDAWEQRKSKDLFIPKIKKGKTELPVLSVTQTSGVVYRDEVGIDIKYDRNTLSNYKVIEPNDFVISLRSFQGGFELSNKLGIASPAYTVFTPKDIDEHANLFWKYKFKTFSFIQSLKTVTFGIRDGKSISFSEFGDLKIRFPKNIREQEKIGLFFKQLDSLITQNGHKIDLLKQLKQAYLQKIFSQKLRFDGFHGTWEERDLSAISDKVTEKNKENQFSETFTNSAEYGIINQRDFFDKDISNEKNLSGYYIVHENDFVYNPRISNYAPVGPIKRNKLGRTGVMSPLYYVFRSRGVDKKYLEYYFDTTAWHIFLKMNGDSGARSDRFAIKDSVFNQMPIPYPTIGEQEQIGSFFEKLDKTIALRQQKLNLLKKQKHAYLQKMFI